MISLADPGAIRIDSIPGSLGGQLAQKLQQALTISVLLCMECPLTSRGFLF
jgi:hypothetical protein